MCAEYVAGDYGSAPASAGYCTCPEDDGAMHEDTSHEWLGGSSDSESTCYDDNDENGIIEIYTTSLTDECGDEFIYGCLFDHSIAAVEVDICVSDRWSGRYTETENLYFTGFYDANRDGDFDDTFDWGNCPEGDSQITANESLFWLRQTALSIDTNEPIGECGVLNSTCLVLDPRNWPGNCKRFRLTFRTPCNMPVTNDFWMRFRLGYGTCPTDPCGVEAAGEVEDVSGTDSDLFEPECDSQTAGRDDLV